MPTAAFNELAVFDKNTDIRFRVLPFFIAGPNQDSFIPVLECAAFNQHVRRAMDNTDRLVCLAPWNAGVVERAIPDLYITGMIASNLDCISPPADLDKLQALRNPTRRINYNRLATHSYSGSLGQTTASGDVNVCGISLSAWTYASRGSMASVGLKPCRTSLR